MNAPAPSSAEKPPRGLVLAMGVAGGFLAFVAWDQSHWWRVKEDYSFGWLVPLFTAYVVYDRWPQVLERLRQASAGPAGPRWARMALNIAAALCLAFGALLFLLGAFYRPGAGISQPGTFALTVGMAAVVLPLLFFSIPAATGEKAVGGNAADRAGAGWRALGAEPRLRVVGLFVFPVLIWLISAPLVSAVEAVVSTFLLGKVVAVVAFCFDLLGYPIERQGNVLVLPRGAVGVADACSGIRSLTACLFAGSFLGAVFFDRLWKKVVLVAAAMAFAFVMNLARSLFLTAWAYARGPEAITGTIHDAAGYAVLGLTCAGLLLLVPILNLRIETGNISAGANDPAG